MDFQLDPIWDKKKNHNLETNLISFFSFSLSLTSGYGRNQGNDTGKKEKGGGIDSIQGLYLVSISRQRRF